MNAKVEKQIAEMKKQTIGVEVEMNNISRDNPHRYRTAEKRLRLHYARGPATGCAQYEILGDLRRRLHRLWL